LQAVDDGFPGGIDDRISSACLTLENRAALLSSVSKATPPLVQAGIGQEIDFVDDRVSVLRALA
jgi:hypothetical protein